MCLKELRDEFLYDCECRHLAKGSLRNYRASTRFLLEFLERKQITELEDVRPRHLRDLMKEKQDAGNTPRYINDLLKVWRTWFNYLVEEGYMEERDNPAKKVKPLRQPRTIIDTFTAAEMKRMIQFYDGKDFLEVRNKTIIMLLFDTGMRCNEMILIENVIVIGYFNVVFVAFAVRPRFGAVAYLDFLRNRQDILFIKEHFKDSRQSSKSSSAETDNMLAILTRTERLGTFVPFSIWTMYSRLQLTFAARTSCVRFDFKR